VRKNITEIAENITEGSPSNAANLLDIGSPNRAKMGTGLRFFRCPERLQADPIQPIVSLESGRPLNKRS
jgi:hypothetical protein